MTRCRHALLIVLLVTGCGRPAELQSGGGIVPTLQNRPAALPAIVLDTRSSGPSIVADSYGASLATWYDILEPWIDPSLRQTGIALVRFPGGSESDVYHWENGGSLCNPKDGYIQPQSTFDNLMRHVAKPTGTDIAVTLNYGSNRTCSGGGDPTEAAAWVAFAKSHGYANAKYWTVGNEVYGSWEYDLHSKPHDPRTYADAVRTGYYPDVKRANPQAQLGVVADFDQPGEHNWNSVVFREAAPFDFLEIHYYPQYFNDSDEFLLGPAITNFARDLAGLYSEMSAAGLPKTFPVYLGEFNNDAAQEGKQSVSIVNGLYLGQMLGTLQTAGVQMATWWLAYGSCDQNGDFSKSLYGWQNFGSEALFSDGLPNHYEGCANTPAIAGGTPFPPARVMALYAQSVPGGSSIRTTSVADSLGTNVRAYGYATPSGYTLILFNNALSAIDVVVRIKDAASKSFDATLSVYGKAQYDASKDNHWIGPATHHLGLIPSPGLPLLLPDYSVTALTLTEPRSSR